MNDGTTLRQTFDREAELYHAIRPRYPAALFDVLVSATGLQQQAKLVEIGPGTGQATKPLAQRGYRITAIELGGALATVARRELQLYQNVRVITGAFEEIELPAHSFDLVLAATALHWIKPDVRFAKPHRLLKSHGHLAIMHTHHVSDEHGDIFFHASQTVYDRYYANDGEGKPRLPAPADIQATELDSALFTLTHFARFPLAVDYTAHAYAQLLTTYSPTLALPERQRSGFLADMETLINKDFGGIITKQFVMSLTVGEAISR